MNVDLALRLARKHLSNGAEMASSARVAMADAVAALDRGDLTIAVNRARRSLAYSVGIFHADYQRVDAMGR